jgi:APA family basic amino acid/polyamine antiporter
LVVGLPTTGYIATESVIVLRWREPGAERPYQVTSYPLTPPIFSGVCGLLIYSSTNYARAVKPTSLKALAVMLAAGLVVYWLTGSRRTRPAQASPEVPAEPQNFA